MYERFTDAARRSLVNANQKAERCGHNSIGSLHILFAILDSDSDVLDAPSMNLVQMKETSAELLSTLSCAGAKQAVQNACALVGEDKSKSVDVPHLVLGIMAEPDPSVALLFNRTSLDIDEVRTYVREQLTRH